MTALSPRPTTRRPVPGGIRGPVRVVLRLHRRTVWTVTVPAALGIVALIGTYLWLGSVSDAFAATGCDAENVTRGCGIAVRRFLSAEDWFNRMFTYAELAMTLLPVFIGLFVAGPLIGRELESGTYRLSWTQSVSPTRWLAVQLAVPAALTVAGVSVLSAVSAWAWSRTDTTHYPQPWYEREAYAAMGTVPVGYSLCMVAFGALAALVLRRATSAMIVTLLAYIPLVMGFNSVRNRLWPTLTDTFPAHSHVRRPAASVETGAGWITSAGKRLPADPCLRSASDRGYCPAPHNVTHRYLDYHPASHFWPLQLVETGILLVLAAAAVALAFRVLRRRHG